MAKIEDFYCSLEVEYKLNSVNFNKNFSKKNMMLKCSVMSLYCSILL